MSSNLGNTNNDNGKGYSVISSYLYRRPDQNGHTLSRFKILFLAYVRDSAFPALYDWCSITVRVEDTNDHTPYFQHREFFQTVPENLRDRNTSIFQVVAQDDDDGDNSRITYSILSKSLLAAFRIRAEYNSLVLSGWKLFC